jgi:hypothetical protein
MRATQKAEFSTRLRRDGAVVLHPGDCTYPGIVAVAARRACKTVTWYGYAGKKIIVHMHYFLACRCRTCILQMRIRFGIKDERRLGGRE